MRNKKILINVLVSVLLHITNSILALFVRKVFLIYLGADILGINSVYSSILAFLSLSELGLGMTISVCLYKPLAEKRYDKVSAYMKLLKKIYFFLGGGILIVGVLLLPLVPLTLTVNLENKFIYISFFIYLLTTASSYFFSYKRTLLYADQNAYIYQGITIIFKFISNFGYIFALIHTQNYYVYLSVGLLCGIAENLVVSIVCDKLYGNIRIACGTITLEDKSVIKEKLKGMLSLRIGNYLIHGADNIIISKFIGTAIVTFYSNYYLIINMLDAICSNFASNVTSALGNLIYTEKEKLEISIEKILMMQYFIFGITTAAFVNLSTDFINLFFGEEAILPFRVILMMALVYYVNGFSNGIEALRRAEGLFTRDRVINLIVPVLNILISVILVKPLGVCGVLIGTIFCYVIQKMIVLPAYLSYEIREFRATVYYRNFIVYAFLTMLNVFLGWLFTRGMVVDNWIEWILKSVIQVLLVIIIDLILFHKNKIFHEIMLSVKTVLKIRKKNTSKGD